MDDYSSFTWTLFLSSKDETYSIFEKFAKVIQNKKDTNTILIRSDRGGKFENHLFDNYCMINHNFYAPITPQQNDIVERKNIILEELARTMIGEGSWPKYF